MFLYRIMHSIGVRKTGGARVRVLWGSLRGGRIGVVGLCAVAVMLAGVVVGVPSAVGQDADDLCDPGDGVQFSDVDDDDYGSGYILCVRALGLSKGRADGTFGPEQMLNRSQMAAFLARLWRDVLGRSCPKGTHPFTDVPKNHFAAADIACIYKLKITKGAGPDTYAPDASLTASQMTRFIVRLLNRVDSTSDMCEVSGNELAKASACMAKMNIAPSQTEARSGATVTRSQIAVYLIGAWYHASGRGQPPKPPVRPVHTLPGFTPTTTTTLPMPGPTTTTTLPGSTPTTTLPMPGPTTTTTIPDSGGPSVPAKPNAPLVTPGDGQIRVDWTAPADNGSSITAYQVWLYTLADLPSQSYSKTVDGSATSTVFTGLTNGVVYQAQVAARNASGLGAKSEWSSPITPSVPPLVP